MPIPSEGVQVLHSICNWAGSRRIVSGVILNDNVRLIPGVWLQFKYVKQPFKNQKLISLNPETLFNMGWLYFDGICLL
jgi:hypothetical protein